MITQIQSNTNLSFSEISKNKFKNMKTDYTQYLKNNDCKNIYTINNNLINLNKLLLEKIDSYGLKKNQIEIIKKNMKEELIKSKNNTEKYNNFNDKRKKEIKNMHSQNKNMNEYLTLYITLSAIFLITQIGIIYVL